MVKGFNTIRRKVSLIYIGFISLLGILGLVSYFSMTVISQSISSLITTNYNSIERIGIMSDTLREQNTDVILYIFENNREQYTKNFNRLIGDFTSAYKKEYSTIIIPSEMEMTTNIKNFYDEYCEMFKTILAFDLTDPDEAREMQEYYYREMVPQGNLVLNELNKLKKSNETALFGRRDTVSSQMNQTMLFIIGLFILAIGTVYFSWKFYVNRLFRPLYEITQNIHSICQGNLVKKTDLPQEEEDELGLMSRELNEMTSRLAEFEQSTMGSLMEERNRTLAIIRSIAEPMIILDEHSCITMLNQSFEEMFRVSQEECLGYHFLEVISNSEMAEDIMKINFRSREPNNKIIYTHLDGKERYFNIMLSPGSFSDEKRYTIIVFYDITELKMLEKMKTDFIATISHELKTPLTSILMGSDLLIDPSLGSINEEQREIINTIKDDSERLCTLVNDLMELSKIESSNMIYQFSPCDIQEVLKSSLSQFYPQAKKKGVNLLLHSEESLPRIMADFSKLKWVVNNLVSNALKYTGEGDSIKVSAILDAESKSIQVSVEDTGVGIPDDFLEKIFEKYVQVKGCDIEVRGTGLGLAVSKDIIIAHGGKIWCESQLHQGSKFIFLLPIR